MTGFLLGAAMLVSSTGAPPPPAAVIPRVVFTFDLPGSIANSPEIRYRPSDPQPWRSSSRRAQATSTKRHNTTDRIIAVAAGATLGFLAGGTIGGKITDRSDENPDDDTSVLKGIMIGAPIGAVVGGILGWTLTRN